MTLEEATKRAKSGDRVCYDDGLTSIRMLRPDGKAPQWPEWALCLKDTSPWWIERIICGEPKDEI